MNATIKINGLVHFIKYIGDSEYEEITLNTGDIITFNIIGQYSCNNAMVIEIDRVLNR